MLGSGLAGRRASATAGEVQFSQETYSRNTMEEAHHMTTNSPSKTRR